MSARDYAQFLAGKQCCLPGPTGPTGPSGPSVPSGSSNIADALANFGVNLTKFGETFGNIYYYEGSTFTCSALSASGQYCTVGLLINDTIGPLSISSDFGIVWSSAPNAGDHNWQAICMSTDGMIQAATFTDSNGTGGIVLTQNGPQGNWQQVSGLTQTFHGLAMSSSGQYILAGVTNGSLYLYNSNAGTTWNVLTSAGTGIWYDCAMSASGQYMTAVDHNANICVSSNFGATWTRISNTGQNTNFTSVAMSASGQYQTVGSDNQVDMNRFLYTSRDYGHTWVEVNIEDAYISNVAMSATGQYQVATANFEPAIDGIQVSTDFGLTWSFVGATSVFSNPYSVSMSSSGQYLLVTSGSSISWCENPMVSAAAICVGQPPSQGFLLPIMSDLGNNQPAFADTNMNYNISTQTLSSPNLASTTVSSYGPNSGIAINITTDDTESNLVSCGFPHVPSCEENAVGPSQLTRWDNFLSTTFQPTVKDSNGNTLDDNQYLQRTGRMCMVGNVVQLQVFLQLSPTSGELEGLDVNAALVVEVPFPATNTTNFNQLVNCNIVGLEYNMFLGTFSGLLTASTNFIVLQNCMEGTTTPLNVGAYSGVDNFSIIIGGTIFLG